MGIQVAISTPLGLFSSPPPFPSPRPAPSPRLPLSLPAPLPPSLEIYANTRNDSPPKPFLKKRFFARRRRRRKRSVYPRPSNSRVSPFTAPYMENRIPFRIFSAEKFDGKKEKNLFFSKTSRKSVRFDPGLSPPLSPLVSIQKVTRYIVIRNVNVTRHHG